mmetsp:Transcript_62278/g.175569  ORF Transcript_62278/g.175569 Transcript_62278/m.175569 type:complete len:262 (-) Transcript_62278:815-1600(-)
MKISLPVCRPCTSSRCSASVPPDIPTLFTLKMTSPFLRLSSGNVRAHRALQSTMGPLGASSFTIHPAPGDGSSRTPKADASAGTCRWKHRPAAVACLLTRSRACARKPRLRPPGAWSVPASWTPAWTRPRPPPPPWSPAASAPAWSPAWTPAWTPSWTRAWTPAWTPEWTPAWTPPAWSPPSWPPWASAWAARRRVSSPLAWKPAWRRQPPLLPRVASGGRGCCWPCSPAPGWRSARPAPSGSSPPPPSASSSPLRPAGPS